VTQYRYLLKELIFRRGRTIATAVSIGVSVLAAVLLISISTSYSTAIQAPMKSVGADIVAQVSGGIPRALEGLVFPHPNALIPRNSINKIKSLSGVLHVTRGVYLWQLQPAPYKSILGIDDGKAGLGNLNANLIAGAPIAPDSQGILLDGDYATKSKLTPGDTLVIGKRRFKIAGIVDSATGGKVIRADVYMPLPMAQNLAAGAPQVQELYPFGLTDANLLLIKVDSRDLRQVVAGVRSILGKKGVISSEISFRETLDSVLFLSDRIGLILALVIGVFATALVLRATASAVNERQREMAVLLRHVTLTLPASLGGENPIGFAKGAFQAPAQSIALPIRVTAWDWLVPPLITALVCAVVAWVLSARATAGSLWQAVKH